MLGGCVGDGCTGDGCVGGVGCVPGNTDAPGPTGLGDGVAGICVVGICVVEIGAVEPVRRNYGRNQSEPGVPCRTTTSILLVLFGSKSTFHKTVEPCNIPGGSLRM